MEHISYDRTEELEELRRDVRVWRWTRQTVHARSWSHPSFIQLAMAPLPKFDCRGLDIFQSLDRLQTVNVLNGFCPGACKQSPCLEETSMYILHLSLASMRKRDDIHACL